MRNASRPFIHTGVTPTRAPRAPDTAATLIGVGPQGAGRHAPWRAAEEAFRAYLETSRVDDRAADAHAARLPWPITTLPAAAPSLPSSMPPASATPLRPRTVEWGGVIHWAVGVAVTLALAAGIVTAYWVSLPLAVPSVSGALPPARCH